MKTKNKISLIALTITLLLRVQGLAQTITYTNGNPVNTTVAYGGQWTYSVLWVSTGFYYKLNTLGFFKNTSSEIIYNNYPTNGNFQYTISGVSGADDGYYYVGYSIVSYGNGDLGVAGNSPTVYLHVSPAVLTQPTNTTCLLGTTTSLGIAAGPSTATFQWLDAATGTVVANTAAFTTTASMNGERVYCKISNSYGSVSSSSAVLTVGSAPAITTQPVSKTNVVVGNSATLSVAAAGTATLAYQWYRNGVAITGANLNYLTFSPAALTNAGMYLCAIGNSYGTTNTINSTVNVGIPPAITNQSGSLIVTQGQNANFTVSATGTVPLQYYWQNNSSIMAGATNTSYTISNTTPADAAIYTCLASNLFGTASSTGAVLTVIVPPGFNQISSQLLNSGDMRLSFVGNAGINYALDCSFGLSPAHWIPQATNPADANGNLVFTNTPDSTTNNFWRIRSVP